MFTIKRAFGATFGLLLSVICITSLQGFDPKAIIVAKNIIIDNNSLYYVILQPESETIDGTKKSLVKKLLETLPGFDNKITIKPGEKFSKNLEAFVKKNINLILQTIDGTYRWKLTYPTRRQLASAVEYISINKLIEQADRAIH